MSQEPTVSGIQAAKKSSIKKRPTSGTDQLKALISAPSDFRHLAHTETFSQAADVLSDLWKTGEKLPSAVFHPVTPSTIVHTANQIPVLLTADDAGSNVSTPSMTRNNTGERLSNASALNRPRPITMATVEKSVATKIFFEGYFDKLFTGQSGRTRRRKQLERDLEASANLSDAEKRAIRADWQQRETEHIRSLRERVSTADFDILKPLGQGAFGSVKLARERRTGDVFALKTIDKEMMLLRSQEGHVRAERDLLSEASDFAHWIVRLYYSFQDDHKLYLAMEYMPGGDLLSLLIRLDTFPEGMAKFYAAEMVLAVEEAHRLGFVHRDIKPDNFLFTESGHLKLGDFGLATSFHWLHDAAYYEAHRRRLLDLYSHEANGPGLDQDDPLPDQDMFPPTKENVLDYRKEQRRQMAYSVVGTSNYIAPEILLGQGHDKRCDWWSLGIIIYEMLIGYPAFCSSTVARTKQKIVQWKKYLRFPAQPAISRDAQDLIERFVCDATQRLSCDDRANAAAIKAHPWFKDLDWSTIRDCQAPWLPELKDELDTCYFDDVTAAQEQMRLEQEQAAAKQPCPRSATTTSLQQRAQEDEGAEALELRKKMAFKGFTFKHRPTAGSSSPSTAQQAK
ncbi:hypothetical protein RI367_000767 [Sorochytrium milnesiophthora]